ncbi:MAG: hypothetical protein WBV82_18970 [Myxococcaceae bacterium]
MADVDRSSRDTVAVLAPEKNVRRQIARALYAGCVDLRIVQRVSHVQRLESPNGVRVIVLDAHSLPLSQVREGVQVARRTGAHVVALCSGEDRGVLSQVLETMKVENVVALHTSPRALHPIVDEQELRVTCQKLLRDDIFGIEKYLGGWGNEVYSFTVRSADDRRDALTEFEGFLTDLECLPRLVPEIVAAADDVCYFTAACSRGDGGSKVRAPPQALAFGCDGQRLVFSVSQASGSELPRTMHAQLCRAMIGRRADHEPESGSVAVATALKRVHQLVANLQPGNRLELVAGWYLRVASANEFRQTTRSLNVFELPSPRTGRGAG